MQFSQQVSEFANTKDLLQRHNSIVIPHSTKNVSGIFLLLMSIQSIVCNPDPEPRVSDGRQDSKRVPPSKRCELSCYTIQQLESKNHQATDKKTRHQIPRHGYILLIQVLQRLKVQIEDGLLPYFFLFGTFLCFCYEYNPCLRLYLAGEGEDHTSESHHCLLTSLSCFCAFWSTMQSPLLTIFQSIVLVLRRGMLFCFFWIYFCAFLFPFLFLFSAGGP